MNLKKHIKILLKFLKNKGKVKLMELSEKEIDLCLQCAKLGIKVEDVFGMIDEILKLCEPMKQLFEENIEYMKNRKSERIEK